MRRPISMGMMRGDELAELLRERFAGHEAAAPPGAWDAIAGRLAMGTAIIGDPVADLFRERFTGHEAAPDPGAWNGIEQRMAQADPVNALLRERFAGHEGTVPPSAWTAIEGRLGTGATVSAGTSWLGWAIGGTAALLVVGGLYLALDGPAAPEHGPAAPTATVPGEPLAPAPAVRETPPATDRAMAPQPPRPVGAQATGPAVRPTPAGPAPGSHAAEAAPTTPAHGAGPALAPLAAGPSGAVEDDEAVPQAVSPDAAPDPQGQQVVQEVLRELEREGHHGAQAAAAGPDMSAAPEAEDVLIEEDTDGPVLFIPNVFTPNGDGQNERWEPQGRDYQRVAVRIFSGTTGALVFSADELRPWDGNDLQGQPCPTGTYLYAIEVQDLQGRVRAMSNTVNIIR